MEAFSGRRFDAVLFDLDGTLIDSTPAVDRSWAAWSRQTGVNVDLAESHGVPAMTTIARLLPPERREQALALITELELTDTADVIPLPGAVDALEQLPPNRCAIATSCTLALAIARIRAAGVPIPKVLVTVDDVSRGKPDPEPYLKAARELGVEPASCLVVEDAVNGLRSAVDAGCATLALRTTTADELLGAADLIVDDLSRIRWIVDSLGLGLALR